MPTLNRSRRVNMIGERATTYRHLIELCCSHCATALSPPPYPRQMFHTHTHTHSSILPVPRVFPIFLSRDEPSAAFCADRSNCWTTILFSSKTPQCLLYIRICDVLCTLTQKLQTRRAATVQHFRATRFDARRESHGRSRVADVTCA